MLIYKIVVLLGATTVRIDWPTSLVFTFFLFLFSTVHTVDGRSNSFFPNLHHREPSTQRCRATFPSPCREERRRSAPNSAEVIVKCELSGINCMKFGSTNFIPECSAISSSHRL